MLLQLSESLEWDSEPNKWRTTEIQNNTKYYSTVKCFPPTHRRHVVVFIRLCNFVWYFHFCSCFQINCFKRIKFLIKSKTTWWKKVTNSIDIAETSNARDDYIICSHRCVFGMPPKKSTLGLTLRNGRDGKRELKRIVQQIIICWSNLEQCIFPKSKCQCDFRFITHL